MSSVSGGSQSYKCGVSTCLLSCVGGTAAITGSREGVGPPQLLVHKQAAGAPASGRDQAVFLLSSELLRFLPGED